MEGLNRDLTIQNKTLECLFLEQIEEIKNLGTENSDLTEKVVELESFMNKVVGRGV